MLAIAMAGMDVVATIHLAVADTGLMGSTEKLVEPLSLLDSSCYYQG